MVNDNEWVFTEVGRYPVGSQEKASWNYWTNSIPKRIFLGRAHTERAPTARFLSHSVRTFGWSCHPVVYQQSDRCTLYFCT
jgi:hypothetical protein